MTTNKICCPLCGKVNELADAEGYTEEYPREWHSACAAVVGALQTHGDRFDGGTKQSRLDIARSWIEEDFDGADVYDWCRAGCWDAAVAARLAAEGITPTEATEACERLISANGAEKYTDGDPMYSCCNGDTRIDDLVEAAK